MLNVSFWSIVFSIIELVVCAVFDIPNYANAYYVCLGIFSFVFVLLKLNYSLLARVLFFTNLNGFIFFFSLVYGKNSGYEYLFTASIAMAFFLFSFKREKVYVYIFGFVTFFLWLTVYLSGFQLFNLEQIDESSKKIIYANTIFLLFLSIVIQLVYFTKNNIFLYNLNVQTKKQAEEEAEKRTVFLNTMSHEIRTPLNAINGLSYILKSENPEQHQIEYINSLHNNGKKLIQKLNNVLDYSKYQSANFNLENEVCALDDNLKNYSKTFIKDCNQKNLQFVLDIPTPLPSVSIDIAKLHTILNNLLRNAMKFTKNGSVKLSVTDNTTLKRREATKQHNKIQLDFVIKDTGKGISEENIALILADKGIYSKKNNKIGLGLAVVKNLLHLMGSSLHIKSELGVGSTFYFSLWVDKEEATEQIAVENRKLEGKKILLVDDNAVNILVAKQCLQKENMTIAVANNGLEALEKAKKEAFDIILMDIQMPIMNGFEATKKIRAFNTTVPIYALSASILEDVKKDLNEYGFNGLLLKPFKPQHLINTIKENIGYE